MAQRLVSMSDLPAIFFTVPTLPSRTLQVPIRSCGPPDWENDVGTWEELRALIGSGPPRGQAVDRYAAGLLGP